MFPNDLPDAHPTDLALREVAAFLRAHPVSRDLDRDDVEELARIALIQEAARGETILQDGDPAGRLYFVMRGAVEVLKRPRAEDLSVVVRRKDLQHAGTGNETFVITRLGSGALFGEMSYLDGEPVSATVRAAEDCVLLAIDRDRLRQSDRGGQVEQHLIRGLAVTVIRRLRDMSAVHAATLRSELAQSELRVEFSRFFVVTMVLFGIASTVQKLINTGLAPLWQMFYSWFFLLASFAPIAWFAYRHRLKKAAFGLTRSGWRVTLRDSLGVSLALIVLAATVRALMRGPGESMLGWGSLTTYTTTEKAIFLAAYGPHCFIQELIGRGVIQTALARLMPDTHPLAAILMTSALFGIFHFYVSVSFAIITFVVSILFGWLYNRHGNLAGVTAVHLVLGLTSIAFGFN